MKEKLAKYTKGNEGLLLKVGIAGLAYIGVVHPLLKKIGLFESKEEAAQKKLAEQNATSTGSPFNPNYYKTVPGATLLTKAATQALAKTLHDAIGYVYDDEATVFGVFRQLKTKTQVSWLADNFYQMYQTDMYSYLSRNLNASEMATVNQIVAGLA